MIARATPWGTIQTGPDFARFSPLEQEAILAHEIGHITRFHAWKRIGWVLTLRAVFDQEAFFAMCEAQEFEADQYAVDCGMGGALISVLRKFDQNVESHGYPSPARRIGAIHV